MKFVKKLFGENEIEAVLQRLDRLTQDEARVTTALALEVVYGLSQNMNVVMDSTSIHLFVNRWLLTRSIFPLDSNASTDYVRDALGTFHR